MKSSSQDMNSSSADASTHFLFLLTITLLHMICISFHGRYSQKIKSYVTLTRTNLKWGCDPFLYDNHHSKSGSLSGHGTTENGENKTSRYESKGAGEEECAVCLCKVEEGDEVRELRCDHIFHRVCLDRWVGMRWRRTCPLCRGSLAPPRAVTENGEEIIYFNFCSFGSRDRTSWWLR